MLLAFSTNAYTKHELAKAIEGIAGAGFSGIELLADVPHLYPGTLKAEQIAEARSLLEKHELTISNINCNCSFGYWQDAPPEPYFEPSLISPEPKYREDRIDMIKATLEMAHELGADCISITSGRMLGGMPPEAAADQLEESLKPVLDEAERLEINVGIECEPGLFIEYADELAFWIQRMGSTRLGANLDIGHSQVLGEDIPAVVKLLGERIWNLHVEDIPGRKHYHLIPGEGTLDWAALFAALKQINYARGVTVELYTHTAEPDEAAQQSFAFLKPFVG